MAMIEGVPTVDRAMPEAGRYWPWNANGSAWPNHPVIGNRAAACNAAAT